MDLIREKLGLSQSALAGILGISRSAVAMYERSARGLPTAALVQLSEMEILLQASPATAAAPLKKQQAKTKKMFQLILRDATLEKMRAERQLEKLEAKQGHQAQINKLAEGFRKNKQKEQAVLLQNHLSAGDDSFEQQLLLQYRIRVATHKMETALEMMGNL